MAKIFFKISILTAILAIAIVGCKQNSAESADSVTKYLKIENGCLVYKRSTSFILHNWCNDFYDEAPDKLQNYLIFTFDNYGNRARLDSYSQSKEHIGVIIWDAVNNTQYYGLVPHWDNYCHLLRPLPYGFNEEIDLFRYDPYWCMNGATLTMTNNYVDASKRYIYEEIIHGIDEKTTTYKMIPNVVDWYDKHFYWKFRFYENVLIHYRGTSDRVLTGTDEIIWVTDISADAFIMPHPNIPSKAFEDPTLEATWINW